MDAVTIGGIVGNVVSVVGVVIVNKWVQQKHGFDFMVFLSFMHFGVTTVGMRALLHAGLFRYKEASFSGVYKIALGSLGSVGFMNLNLAHNTVGMYQLSKLACIPVTLLLQQTVMGGERAPLAVKLTLVPLMLGMGIATVYDVNVNFVGTVFATVAVLCTVVAQILTSSTQARDARATPAPPRARRALNRVPRVRRLTPRASLLPPARPRRRARRRVAQRELGCDALQLLYHTSPLITLGMLLLSFVFDDWGGLLEYEWNIPQLRDVLISCGLALGVNISNYLVLGKTSPLTYQVIGHLKTISILLLGALLFNKPTSPQSVVGVAIAMGGVVSYTEVKRRIQQHGAATAAPSGPNKV